MAATAHNNDVTLRASKKISDPTERKRNQNRIAQQTYRRNQKQRLRSLEEAVGIRSQSQKQNVLAAVQSTSMSDPIWPSPVTESIRSNPAFSNFDVFDSSEADVSGEKSNSTTIDESTFDTFLVDDVPTIPPNHNRPALHRAVCARQVAMTRLLIGQGADTKRHDSNGQTALHLAVRTGHQDLVKILLDNEVDPNVQNALGQTALFEAVRGDDEQMVKLLLEASIDVNCRDAFGDVALYLAVDKGSELLVQTLLSYGADIEA